MRGLQEEKGVYEKVSGHCDEREREERERELGLEFGWFFGDKVMIRCVERNEKIGRAHV